MKLLLGRWRLLGVAVEQVQGRTVDLEKTMKDRGVNLETHLFNSLKKLKSEAFDRRGLTVGIIRLMYKSCISRNDRVASGRRLSTMIGHFLTGSL